MARLSCWIPIVGFRSFPTSRSLSATITARNHFRVRWKCWSLDCPADMIFALSFCQFCQWTRCHTVTADSKTVIIQRLIETDFAGTCVAAISFIWALMPCFLVILLVKICIRFYNEVLLALLSVNHVSSNNGLVNNICLGNLCSRVWCKTVFRLVL
jgi:hypothetical protein